MPQEPTKPQRTELETLGEFALIDRLTGAFKTRHSSTVLGIGDDAAALETADGYTLISTDLLLEGIHFDLSYVPLEHLGYKAVAVNVSDIAAMNGQCRQVTISIGLSNRFSLEAAEALYRGIKFACDQYEVDLIGGDTSSSQSGLVLSITALGTVDKENLVRRSGAEKDDLICVSGDLGAAYLGLQILIREKQVFLDNQEMQPELDDYQYVIGRQLKAEARTDIIKWLSDHTIKPTAMIDLSDGLASDLLHIGKSSNLGARVYLEKIPIDQNTLKAADELKLDPITCALNGGEDYELLFTISQQHYELVADAVDLTIVGHMTQEPEYLLVLQDGTTTPLTAQGWQHF